MVVAKKKATPRKKKVVNEMGNGWTSVQGIVDPSVGTGLSGAANKIQFGEKVNLPAGLASLMIKAKQVKEIK